MPLPTPFPLRIAPLCFVRKLVPPQPTNLPQSRTQHSIRVPSKYVRSKFLMTTN